MSDRVYNKIPMIQTLFTGAFALNSWLALVFASTLMLMMLCAT